MNKDNLRKIIMAIVVGCYVVKIVKDVKELRLGSSTDEYDILDEKY